jgi:hypothetical protein
MADSEVPKFKAYAEGELIPPVDPEDLRRRWKIPIPWTREALEAAWTQEADRSAVSSRDGMIRMLSDYNRGQLLAPWHHGGELDDAVFRIASKFPIRELRHKPYMIPGDEHFGFDPNAFVQTLIDETGISHVWEPVQIKVPEGGRCFVTQSVGFTGQAPNPEREAKRRAREVAWNIWKRFAPSLDQVVSHCDKEHASEVVATFFADFLMDNIGLVREIEAGFNAGNGGGGLPVLMELERRAQNPWSKL